MWLPSPKGNIVGYYSKKNPQLAVNSYPEFLQQYKLTDIQYHDNEAAHATHGRKDCDRCNY